MSDDKKYSPKEAAIAVLAKAEELLKNSALAKGDWKKIHNKLEREGYSKESADKIDGAIKAKVQKSEEYKDENDKKANAIPSEHNSKDAGQSADGPAPKGEIHPKEHVEGEPAKVGERVETQENPQNNPKERAEGNNPPEGAVPTKLKGTYKLAAFHGHMHHKRKAGKPTA